MFTVGLKKHHPPRVPWSPQQVESSHTPHACNSPCQGTAKSSGYQHYPERSIGQEGPETRWMWLSGRHLREPIPVVKWLTTVPLPPSQQEKLRPAQMGPLGFGKVLTVINRMLHMTPPQSKTMVTIKVTTLSLYTLHGALGHHQAC